MKIALIGNMNNNNFAIMRYFRDLGADAHLLLYSTDGRGYLSHFQPEHDSWEIEKWRPYIHRTDIPNAPVAALDFPLSWMMSSRGLVRSWLGLQDWAPPVSRRQIAAAYAGYDRYVASGITPATLERAGLPLHLFYPYSTGVEFLNAGEFMVRLEGQPKLVSSVFSLVRKRQRSGIRSAELVLNCEMGPTQEALLEIGVEPLKCAPPMVYNQEEIPEAPPSATLREEARAIAASRFSVLHHSRLMWRNPGHYSEEAWQGENKHNDWFLDGFAALVRARPQLDPLLVLLEFGPDVEATRQRIAELGIAGNVRWIPKMERRELMWLLSRVSMAVGQFYDLPRIIWGGTGWETLASGKPLLQGFNFEPGEFEEAYGYPPPPMLPVRAPADIAAHLLDMADHPQKRERIGREAAAWFNRHNGIALARQWLDLLMEPAERVHAHA